MIKKFSTGLVFVPTRSNAKAIQSFIHNHPDTRVRTVESKNVTEFKVLFFFKDIIRSACLIGKTKNVKNAEFDENMSDTMQEKILEKFKNSEYNLLVATSIAAEGVDIPDCNYVIRYEFVSDEIAFIQCRGRARSKDSFYHIVTYRSKNSLFLVL